MDERWIESTAAALLGSAKDHLRGRLEVFQYITESPIETALISIFLTSCVLAYVPLAPARGGILIEPQFRWRTYRIDFCITGEFVGGRMLFVECDGHEFHERTKEQAARDRSRDREIQLAGIPLLRFTGSEIYRQPLLCCADIFDALANLKERAA